MKSSALSKSNKFCYSAWKRAAPAPLGGRDPVSPRPRSQGRSPRRGAGAAVAAGSFSIQHLRGHHCPLSSSRLSTGQNTNPGRAPEDVLAAGPHPGARRGQAGANSGAHHAAPPQIPRGWHRAAPRHGTALPGEVGGSPGGWEPAPRRAGSGFGGHIFVPCGARENKRGECQAVQGWGGVWGSPQEPQGSPLPSTTDAGSTPRSR